MSFLSVRLGRTLITRGTVYRTSRPTKLVRRKKSTVETAIKKLTESAEESKKVLTKSAEESTVESTVGQRLLEPATQQDVRSSAKALAIGLASLIVTTTGLIVSSLKDIISAQNARISGQDARISGYDSRIMAQDIRIDATKNGSWFGK